MKQSPVRVQRTRKKGQGYIFPEGKENDLPIVYVGRPSKWGNPFRGGFYEPCPPYFNKPIESNRVAVKYYANYVCPKGTPEYDRAKKELRGKNLACWCKIGEPCHADVLLEIANQE